MKVVLLIGNNQTSPFIHKNQNPATLNKFGGKFLLEHLLNELLLLTEEDIQELLFVTSAEVALFHDTLKQIATKFNLKTSVHSCLEGNSPLEALTCTEESIKGPVLVLPANIWFRGGNGLTTTGENTILVHKIEDPSEHNVVKLEMNNAVSGFHYKSNEYISDLAPVGGYFFKQGETLIKDIRSLLSEEKAENLDLMHLVEYKIKKGERFLPSLVEGWQSCKDPDDMLEIHRRVIAGFTSHRHIADSAKIMNTVILSPVYIGENAKILNSVVGPNVSIGDNALIENALVNDSIVAEGAQIKNVKLGKSLLGNHSIYEGKEKRINLGDYSYLKE